MFFLDFKLAFEHLMNHFSLFLLVRAKISRSLNFLDFKAVDLLIFFDFFAEMILFIRNINIFTAFYIYFNNLSWLSVSFNAYFWVNLFKIKLCLWWSFAWWKQINANIFCLCIKFLIECLLIDRHGYLFLSTCVMLSWSVRRSWIFLFALCNLS